MLTAGGSLAKLAGCGHAGRASRAMAAKRPLMVTVEPKRQTRSPARAAIGFKTGVLADNMARDTARASMPGGRRVTTRSPRLGIACVTI